MAASPARRWPTSTSRAPGLLLGRGDTRAARPLLEETARILALSLEPQYLAGSGALRGELERREGDLDAARAVVEEAIDRIEFCSEDGERLAEVACVGVRVEADAAERARDLGDEEAERGARLRAEMMHARVQAAADDLDLPVPSAHAASAAADAARAAGEADPALYAAAAEAWERARAPVPRRAVPASPGRGAPARRRPRRHGRRRPRGRTPPPARLGAALAASTRSRASPPAPGCGSTSAPAAAAERSRRGGGGRVRAHAARAQVLALLAGGATNREIGAQLFMAEKTASVHVSRILSKLDVRSRDRGGRRRPPARPRGRALNGS